MINIEVCTGSIGDSITAWEAGASRLELNSGLETGGLTPAPGTASLVIKEVDIPVVVMIRPRTGAFIYSILEKRAMLSDVKTFIDLGASGVVFGALEPGGGIDREFVSEVRSSAADREIIFHRAFDLTEDKNYSASILADLGVNRILTSGGEASAYRGRKKIRELIRLYEPDLEILPGSGINGDNAAELVLFTGCRWIHGSFCESISDGRTISGIVPAAAPGFSPRVIEAVILAVKDIQ